MIPIGLATVAFLLASSSLEEIAPYSVWVRVFGLAAVAIPLLGAKAQRKSPQNNPRVTRGIAYVSFGYIIYLSAATLPHHMADEFIARLLAVGLIMSLIVLVQHFYYQHEIGRGLQLGLAAVVFASLILAQSAPSVAFENGRLRGILENANLLGFVAAALIVVTAVVATGAVMTFMLSAVAMVVLAMTGSRASLLFLAICIIGFALVGHSRGRRMLALGTCLAVLGLLIVPDLLTGQYVLRTDNTREVGISEALRVLAESPFFGLGHQSESILVPVAGSPAAAVVQGGGVGLLGLIISYLGLLAAARRIHGLALVTAVGLIVHSIFESWMIALGGPMALVAFLAWAACASAPVPSSAAQLTDIANAPADTLIPEPTSSRVSGRHQWLSEKRT